MKIKKKYTKKESRKILFGFMIIFFFMFYFWNYAEHNGIYLEDCELGFKLDRYSYADEEGNIYPGCIKCEFLKRRCYQQKLKKDSYYNNYMNFEYPFWEERE